MNKDITFAVIVRSMYDELPFLNEFVYHYITLGFNKIYYINTDGEEKSIFQELSLELHKYVFILNMPNNFFDWQEVVLNRCLGFVVEDWILSVDMDEFLYLHNQSIQEYVSNLRSDLQKVRFQWVLSLSTNYTQNSVFELSGLKKYESKLFKTLAKREFIQTIAIHDIYTYDNQKTVYESPHKNKRFIFHFASRGFLDLFNRIIGRNYQNIKSDDIQFKYLEGFIKQIDTAISEYPFRFHLFRIELTFPEFKTKAMTFPPPTKYQTNNSLLKEIFLKKLHSIGIEIPINNSDSIEDYLEIRFKIRKRIMHNLPNSKYFKMHLLKNLSYVNITKIYLDDLKKGYYKS
ncbi:MAG: glycosyltransferase family 2 protein [Haliscomenobacter sp.]|nr:glycosyltransferase family 2 protein [Haliscomenobacter sp.]